MYHVDEAEKKQMKKMVVLSNYLNFSGRHHTKKKMVYDEPRIYFRLKLELI